MVLSEDVRKSLLISNLISLANLILKDSGLDAQLLTNQVFPMQKTSGLIQYIPGQMIELTEGKSLDLFQVLKTFHNTKVHQTQSYRQYFNSFLEGAAVYYVLGYLLNYGDKIQTRITVTKQGQFYFEDITSLLGEMPIKKLTLTPSSVIPQALRDAIDRSTSQGTRSFDEFVQMCCKIYIIFRSHQVLFSTLLNLLFTTKPPVSYQFTREEVERCLNSRFLPMVLTNEAREIFDKTLRSNTATLYQWFL
jgi:phosphatidylinositol kinase/protein kinase (PI-3  family)